MHLPTQGIVKLPCHIGTVYENLKCIKTRKQMVDTRDNSSGNLIGNIAPSAGIEPTSLVSSAHVLTIIPSRLPGITTLLMPNCLCSSLPQRSVQNTTLLNRNSCLKIKDFYLTVIFILTNSTFLVMIWL